MSQVTQAGRTTKLIVKIIYGENIENFDEKVEKLDPVIRKLAHYSIYLFRWNFNFSHDVYI